jgi:hypothetical protein
MRIRYLFKRCLCRTASVLALAFLFSLPSLAAELFFYVGGVQPGDINYENVKTSLDGSPIYGVRLSTGIVPSFGIEHTLAFSSDFLFPNNDTEVDNTKGFVYNSNLILSLPLGRVRPYLTAGAGVIHQYGSSELPVGTKFALNYGGGLKLPRLFGPLGLRIDLRGYSAGFVSNKLNLFEVAGGAMLSLGD